MIASLAIAGLLLAAEPTLPPSPEAGDEELLRHLELVEQLELLERFELLVPEATEPKQVEQPPAPKPAPPAQPPGGS
jgi:hypothetical protein